jgi:hypothetical protein
VPTGKTLPEVCDFVQTRLPDVVQLSVAVGSTHTALWSQLARFKPVKTVLLAGQPLIAGGVLSIIVTEKLQFIVLRLASLTVYIIMVIPALNKYVPIALIPNEGDTATVAPVMTHVSLLTPQLSEYVGDGTTTVALHEPDEEF